MRALELQEFEVIRMLLGCTVLHTLLMLYAYSMVKPAYHLQTILFPLFAPHSPPHPHCKVGAQPGRRVAARVAASRRRPSTGPH